jgi:predicted PurR-regulated permease PerM
MHPLAILIATLLGGLLAGMVGLILAAPVTAIVVHVYHELGSAGFFAEPSDP